MDKKLSQIITLIRDDIGSIRTGKPSASLVQNVDIPAYGGAQVLKLQELANITAPDTQTLVIDPWDKSIIGDINKGLLTANIGMNPSIDGDLIRISFPPMTTEDREKLAKLLNGKIESGKVMIRQVRAEEMKQIKDSFDKKELSEDEKFEKEKGLQKKIDEFIDRIIQLGETKKKELLTV